MSGPLEHLTAAGPVGATSRSNPLPTSPARARITGTFTRPNDTDSYAALDAVANATSGAVPITFAGAALSEGGGGVITGAVIQCSDSAKTPAYRLHLYSATPATVSADNAAFNVKLADAALYLGYIDFPPTATEGAGSDVAVAQAICHLEYSCAATSLFGRLETLLAIATPTALATFRITLCCAELY